MQHKQLMYNSQADVETVETPQYSVATAETLLQAPVAALPQLDICKLMLQQSAEALPAAVATVS